MEQLNKSNKWYRFPILIVDKTLKNIYEEQDIPKDQMKESWVDIRLDSIVNIRPYYEGEDFQITGTLIHTTSGDDFGVELKPSTVRKLLGYEPQILKSEFNETTSD